MQRRIQVQSVALEVVVIGKTLVVASLLGVALPPAIAMGQLPSDPESLARFCLAGWVSNGDHWRSGEFRVAGHLKVSDEKSPLDGPMELYSAFDLEAGLFRFERKEPIWKIPALDSNAAKNANAPLILSHQGGKYISTPDKSIVWRDDGQVASIARPERRKVSAIMPFEIHLIGGQSWYFLDSTYYERPNWRGYVEALKETPIAEAVVEEGLVRLTWIDAATDATRVDARQDLWLNPQQGFCPIKYMLRTRNVTLKADWPEVAAREVTTARWEKRADFWIPMYCRQEEFGSSPRSREFNFQWISVNEPIDPKKFTLEALNYPESKEHVDFRLGRPVTVQPIERQLQISDLQPATAPRAWLLGVNGCVLALIVIFYLGKSLTKWIKPPSVGAK